MLELKLVLAALDAYMYGVLIDHINETRLYLAIYALDNLMMTLLNGNAFRITGSL